MEIFKWWLGNILAGWVCYGSNKNLGDEWAWRVPTVVQAAIPAIVMVLIMFFPESPRWLIAHDRPEEALAIFAKYHGNGDENSPIVQLQYHEIIEQMNATQNDNPWWDFRELVNTKGARYRLFMVIAMSFFGQWSGNNVVSYFMVSSAPWFLSHLPFHLYHKPSPGVGGITSSHHVVSHFTFHTSWG
jgi:MFS family permease